MSARTFESGEVWEVSAWLTTIQQCNGSKCKLSGTVLIVFGIREFSKS
jgi:hypothetical protein